MAENNKPLPRPASRPFGNRRTQAEPGEQGSMADQLAEAAALGKLDEYLERELPDSEEARTLAKMMMGMTGMMPGAASTPPSAERSREQPVGAAMSMPPEDVQKAVQEGDVRGLMGLLRKEHLQRNPGAETGPPTVEAEAQTAHSSGMSGIDKELIDEMIRIASDNSVTLDWIIFRAIKVYVEEYRKTGRL